MIILVSDCKFEARRQAAEQTAQSRILTCQNLDKHKKEFLDLQYLCIQSVARLCVDRVKTASEKIRLPKQLQGCAY
jgi:hypothetical protein